MLGKSMSSHFSHEQIYDLITEIPVRRLSSDELRSKGFIVLDRAFRLIPYGITGEKRNIAILSDSIVGSEHARVHESKTVTFILDAHTVDESGKLLIQRRIKQTTIPNCVRDTLTSEKHWNPIRIFDLPLKEGAEVLVSFSGAVKDYYILERAIKGGYTFSLYEARSCLTNKVCLFYSVQTENRTYYLPVKSL